MQLESKIEINAPSKDVWSVLTDFDHMASWNPFITEISGRPEPGSRIRVQIVPPGGRSMTFRPMVVTAEPDRVLKWLGRMVIPGIFDGEHEHRIDSLPGNRARYTQTERFSGVLVPFAGKLLARTQAGFESMAVALKQRAEAIRRSERAGL